MFSASVPVSTSLKLKLPSGEALRSSNDQVVSVAMAGPMWILKAVAQGEATVALIRGNVEVDSCYVTVTV